MNLSELIKWFAKVDTYIDDSISDSFVRESRFYLRLMKQFTPRDSGDLSDSWNITDSDSSGKDKIATIENNLIYASPIEFGSEPGQLPWKSPGPRTVNSDGAIFSIQAVGGVAKNAINDSDVKITAEHMANDIMRKLA